MKYHLHSSYSAAIVSIGLAAMSLFSSCSDHCEVENSYTYLEPVYMTLGELRSSVAVTDPEPLEMIGKIYFKDGYLFVNEPNLGFHVIDNRNPANPLNVAFINVPGSFDMAVNGNILYSDSYMDLVAIDISNIQAVKEIGRIENVFDNYNSYGFYASPEQGVVTDWVEKQEVTITESSCEGQMYTWGVFYEDGIALANAEDFRGNLAVSPTNPGIGGSMARFTVANGQLFALNQADVQPIDITSPANMSEGAPITLDWGIETIFPYDNNLFIGAVDGMYILDVNNALEPQLISKYQHIQSCDPVVVQDHLAYVTLRSGTECQGFSNQLEVIDIADLTSPQLLYTYEMNNPHGLGIDGATLFVCDGTAGLKVYDASESWNIGNRLLAQYPEYFAYDVIPYNNVAMLIGDDGLYQYDYSDVSNIQLLSKIEITYDNH